MERKLASIQKILSLEPIEGADAIEKATVLGWSVVVEKDKYKVNELVVYMEIDSLLPDKPEFEFLRARKFRIKTVRLRGQISQGIAFPLSILPECRRDLCFEGEDVSEILGVTKYEPPISAQLRGKIKGNFPGFIPKTDEMRIQAFPNVLIRHKGKTLYITEKLDGCSMTVHLRDGEFGVSSRNLELLEDTENTLWLTTRALDLEAKLKAYGKNLALQGELIGPGIQKNRYGLRVHNFYVFNAYDIDSGRYLNFLELQVLVGQLELNMVPVVGELTLDDNITVEVLVELSKGTSKLKQDQMREGIVLRPLEEERDEELGRLSFKAINPEFLLKYED
jgi:RNA ligase (TIGR02306 family)